MDETRRIATLEEVPDDTTLLFRVRTASASDDGEDADGRSDDERREGEAAHEAYGSVEEAEGGTTETDAADDAILEAIAVRLDGEVACWLNYCQHLTHIHLDKGSGATMRNGELVCENHGAYFESDTGLCTYGPCEGAYLNPVEVTVDDGAVYLTDDRYAFVGRGGLERDALDRASKSNVEF